MNRDKQQQLTALLPGKTVKRGRNINETRTDTAMTHGKGNDLPEM